MSVPDPDVLVSKPHVIVTPGCETYINDQNAVPAYAVALAAASDRLSPGVVVRATLGQYTFLRWLAATLGATRILEVGTFAGLSTLALAEGGGPDAHVRTFDIVEDWQLVGDRAWSTAGVRRRIMPHPVAVQAWLTDHTPGTLDLVYLDGDKIEYVEYFDLLLPHVRVGGVIVVDDTLWPYNDLEIDMPEQHAGIRRFNDHVRDDPRVEGVLLPLVNGMTLLRKVAP